MPRVFKCAFCGLTCVADDEQRTVDHQAPACEMYTKLCEKLGGQREPDVLRDAGTGEIVKPIGNA